MGKVKIIGLTEPIPNVAQRFEEMRGIRRRTGVVARAGSDQAPDERSVVFNSCRRFCEKRPSPRDASPRGKRHDCATPCMRSDPVHSTGREQLCNPEEVSICPRPWEGKASGFGAMRDHDPAEGKLRVVGKITAGSRNGWSGSWILIWPPYSCGPLRRYSSVTFSISIKTFVGGASSMEAVRRAGPLPT